MQMVASPPITILDRTFTSAIGDYWNRTRYSSSPGQCRDCPLASTCAAKNRPNAPHTRFVLRPVDQDIFDEVQLQMNEPEFRKKSRSGCGKYKDCGPKPSRITVLLGQSTVVGRRSRSRRISSRLCRTSSACSSHFIAGCWRTVGLIQPQSH